MVVIEEIDMVEVIVMEEAALRIALLPELVVLTTAKLSPAKTSLLRKYFFTSRTDCSFNSDFLALS